MEFNSLFTRVHHGFLAGRFCITQLPEFIEDVIEITDRGDEIDIKFLDFCKAFDKVTHKILMQK